MSRRNLASLIIALCLLFQTTGCMIYPFHAEVQSQETATMEGLRKLSVETRNGEITILDPKGRELEKYEVPAGSNLLVEENHEVKPGTVLCQWDPHSIPILAEVGGKVRYEDVIQGDRLPDHLRG